MNVSLHMKVREIPQVVQTRNQQSSKARNRPFSKMAAENLNKSKLKTYTSTRKNPFTLVTRQSLSISGVLSAEKM